MDDSDYEYRLATVHAWFGEADQAFQWLDRAFAKRNFGMRLLKVDPLLKGVRADPRYAALVRKMNFPPD